MKKLFKYTNLHDRKDVITFLESKKFKRVLDVGYSANTWSSLFVTHYIDINQSDKNKKMFKGDINMPFVWDEIEKDVNENGKFDFVICTHTLEDIINPYYVTLMLEKYANMGFIAVPSKYEEFTRGVNGPYMGHIHHRYIFNKENDEFVGYPKLNFIETDNTFSKISDKKQFNNGELQFFWKDSISLKIINNNYMGPNVDSVLSYYQNLLNNL
jgi:hypothetical protein